MKNKRLPIIVVVALLASFAFYVRPYNSAEFNAATAYYQSYSQFYSSVNQYVELLEEYDATKDIIYLEKALIKLDNVRDNLRMFRLTSQTDFRDTVINQKVVKSTVFSLDTLNAIAASYEDSQVILDRYIAANAFDVTGLKDFIHYHNLMLNGLKADNVGYDVTKKEFAVVVNRDKIAQLQEGSSGLRKIIEENNYSEEEKTVLAFLKNVYSASEEDVEQYQLFRNYLDSLAKNSSSKSVEIDDTNEYVLYLKSRYNLSDKNMDVLMANRQADYYIKKSFEEGMLYAPDKIEIEYVDSLESYQYEVLISDKVLKGFVRIENNEIAGFKLQIDAQ